MLSCFDNLSRVIEREMLVRIVQNIVTGRQNIVTGGYNVYVSWRRGSMWDSRDR